MLNIKRRLIYVYILAAVFSISGAVQVAARTSIKEEIEIGQKAAKEIEKEFPVTDNKEWLADIDKMGKLLIANVERKDIPYTFKIIKEEDKGKPQIDAFSLPGGPVYFSERMWRILTRNERLGVLAHEIAHVDKRHAIDTISEMNRRGLWAAAILIITGAKNDWWNAADIANTLYTLKYSRKREQEADLMAIDLTRAAGESPTGLVTAMQKLLRLEKELGGKPMKILSTHPETEDRVKYLTEKCIELGYKPEDLQLKFKDEADRMGDVVSKAKEGTTVIVSTTQPLKPNDLVWIKKPLWDDVTNTVIPKPVAKGTVLTSGLRTDVSVVMEKGFDFSDIEAGDGVYPRKPDPVPPPPKAASPVNTKTYYIDRK